MLATFLVGFGLASAPALDCGPGASDRERAACLGAELARADDAINTTYAALRARMDSGTRIELRDAQRAWIRRRDQVCGLDPSQGSRAAWLAGLAQDYGKTVCVVRFTTERVVELNRQLSGALGVAPSSAPEAANDGAIYDVRSPTARTSGKWYFEVDLKVARLAVQEQAIFVGARGANGPSTGTLQTIRRRDAALPDRNIGVAVDLDNGKVYLRQNGVWSGGAPGSSGGADVKLGRPYLAWVSSSVEMGQALQNRAIDVNLGARHFDYALPDGYRPMDETDPTPVPSAP